MLAPAPTISASSMTAPSTAGYGRALPPRGQSVGQGSFKKHKVLPRPEREVVQSIAPNHVPKYDLITDTSLLNGASTSSSGSSTSSPRTLKHRTKQIGAGPDLPPTPPIHSRSSSGTHAPKPPSPTDAEPLETPKITIRRAPATPPDQRSPPTPDVTPPQPVSRPRALRPLLGEDAAVRATPTESRTESFKTAREEPFSSEDEDGRSTIRPLASNNTSQTSVRRIVNSKPAVHNHVPQPQALGLALSKLNASDDGAYTPRTKKEFGQFDGDWASSNEVEKVWDDNLQRNVTVRKRQNRTNTVPRREPRKDAVVEDNIITPTSATQALRRMPLRETGEPAPLKSLPQQGSSRSRPSTSGTSTATDVRRSSTVSGQTIRSTIVEAYLLDRPPQRQRTLRHVQKQSALRGSVESLPSSTAQSWDSRTAAKAAPKKDSPYDHGRGDSMISTKTNQSMASSRARREVWKSGGIPVVVVPDRRSSTRSKSREPSLRSTSSRRSKRTTSLDSSTPMSTSTNRDVPPLSGNNLRRGRAYSESDGSDVRTIDYPPSIPARSSSLSAPTSRNNSRAGSMTVESVKARDALSQESKSPVQLWEAPVSAPPPAPERERRDEPQPSQHHTGRLESPFKPEKEELHPTMAFDHFENHLGEPQSPKKFSSRNTPFSIVSLDTNGTAPELSEAQAVQMFAHQNSSVVMVDHSAKPSDASDLTSKATQSQDRMVQPEITMTAPGGNGPVTPPQPQFALEDVDSPLRNPRAPPEPPSHPPAMPAFNFIPATPSGMTPADERNSRVGNYWEATGERPPRRPSLVRRALSHRRHSVEYPPSASKTSGFLTRTFSLSRNTRRMSASRGREISNPDLITTPTYPQAEDMPPEEGKLHPFWRPPWDDEDSDSCGSDCDHDEVYRYPPIDNRPRMPKRSLSARMKRTFAIMPIRDDAYYYEDASAGPERRAIGRTPSGNLRVMRRRSTAPNGKTDAEKTTTRPFTAPEGNQPKTSFWRGHSGGGEPTQQRKRRSSISSIGSTIEEIQSIPRRLSEKRREKRNQELRSKISAPTAVRDGVGEVIRSNHSGTRRLAQQSR